MQVSATVEKVTGDLVQLAAIADETTARVAERLLGALGPALRVRLWELLGEAAVEASSQLRNGRLELRMAGDDASLVLDLAVEPDPALPVEAADRLARISLRLPEGLKAILDRRADQEGVSTNAWIVKTLNRVAASESYDTPIRHRGKRLRGIGEA